MNPATRVLVVDDHPMLRSGVIQLIELEEDLQAVGEAGDGERAVEMALALDPDLVLLDLNMKGMSGIETLCAMRESGVAARIVVFTVSDIREDVVAALRAGADGYLLKDMEPDVLIERIKQAALGQMVLSGEIMEALALAIQQDKRKSSTPDVKSLTRRERQILRLIASGMSNKLIAQRLTITEGTVKVHVKRLFRKLHLKSRVAAAIWCHENKLT